MGETLRRSRQLPVLLFMEEKVKKSATAIAMLVFAAACGGVHAQAYPEKTVRIIVHNAAGTVVDTPPRGVAEALSKIMGQPFIIENRPGADGFIGTELCAKAAPDGHTLCSLSQATVTMNQFYHATMPYDPERDFAPITYMGTITSALVVHPSVKAASVRELVEIARAKPDSLQWATLGNTGAGTLYLEWLKKNASASFYQIPYKTNQNGFQAIIAGDAHAMIYPIGPVPAQAKAGKIKVLAVTTTRRWPAMPGVPTMGESGFDLHFNTWLGFFAPVRTPKEIIGRLNSEIMKIRSDEGFQAKFLTTQGILVEDVNTPEQFAAFIAADRRLVRSLVVVGAQK